MNASLLIRILGGAALSVAAAFVGGCSGGGNATAPAIAAGAGSSRTTGSITVVYPQNIVRAASSAGVRAPRFIDPTPGAILKVTVGSTYIDSTTVCYTVSPGSNGTQTLTGVPVYAGGGTISIVEYQSGTVGTCSGLTGELAATTTAVSYYDSYPAGSTTPSISVASIVLQPYANSIVYALSATGTYAPFPLPTPSAPAITKLVSGICAISSPIPAPVIVYFQTVDAANGFIGAGVVGGGFPPVGLQPGTAPSPVASTAPVISAGPVPGSIKIELFGSGDTVSVPIQGTDAFGNKVYATPTFGC